MQIDSRSLPFQPMRGATRPQAGTGPQSGLNGYLPNKDERVKVEDAPGQDSGVRETTLRTRGIFEADFGRMDTEVDDFMQILKKALDAKGFDDPKAFLKTLSSKELETLQHAHGLSGPIDVDKLSPEDALALLQPPGAQRVEMTGDEEAVFGPALAVMFPPETAPKDVMDAWNKAMEGVDDADRAQLEMLLFLTPRDADGTGEDMPMDIEAFRRGVARALDDLKAGGQVENEQQRALTDRLSKLLEKFDKELAARESGRNSGVQTG